MATETRAPRSRRALLAAAAGGLAGLVTGALGRPAPAKAALGDPMILGQANDSGTYQTILANAGLGAAFTLKTTNTSTGATGIFGWSSSTGPNATRGVYGKADGPNSYGVYGRQSGSTDEGAAVFGEGNNNTGVVGTTVGAYGVVGINGGASGIGIFGVGDGTGIYGLAHGGASEGVLGESDGNQGTGVYGWASAVISQNYAVYARTESSEGYGVYSEGDVNIDGDLFATGSKVGYVADVAVNGSKATLRQGDAVTLIGVKPAVLGKIPLLEVAPAKAGDAIVGIVDRLVEVTATNRPRGLAGKITGIHGKGTTVKPGDHLLVVTMGAFAVAGVDASDGAIAVGDELAVGVKAGKLGKSKGTGRTVGYALGQLADGTGKIGVFVSPR